MGGGFEEVPCIVHPAMSLVLFCVFLPLFDWPAMHLTSNPVPKRQAGVATTVHTFE